MLQSDHWQWKFEKYGITRVGYKFVVEKDESSKPYHVSWINDEHKVFVSKKCLVKFKIGYYFDEVLCDIMPMDCCHILLVRPWQYDRHAVHDGRLNQYTLWVNEKKQTLLPLIEVLHEVNCTAIKVYMVNGKQFEKEVKRNQVCFSIILRRSSCSSSS